MSRILFCFFLEINIFVWTSSVFHCFSIKKQLTVMSLWFQFYFSFDFSLFCFLFSTFYLVIGSCIFCKLKSMLAKFADLFFSLPSFRPIRPRGERQSSRGLWKVDADGDVSQIKATAGAPPSNGFWPCTWWDVRAWAWYKVKIQMMDAWMLCTIPRIQKCGLLYVWSLFTQTAASWVVH